MYPSYTIRELFWLMQQMQQKLPFGREEKFTLQKFTLSFSLSSVSFQDIPQVQGKTKKAEIARNAQRFPLRKVWVGFLLLLMIFIVCILFKKRGILEFDKKLNMEGRIVNLPNFLSFLRILLIPWFLYYFHTGHLHVAIVIMIVAVLTDWFDGQAARWTNEVSEMGKILDPLADKLCLASVALYFLWMGQLPLWFVLFAVLRDILIFIGAGYVKFRHSVVTTSLWPGKWAVGFVSMMFIAMVWPHPFFRLYPVKEFFLYLSTVMLLYSFFLYCMRFFKIHKGLEFKV